MPRIKAICLAMKSPGADRTAARRQYLHGQPQRKRRAPSTSRCPRPRASATSARSSAASRPRRSPPPPPRLVYTLFEVSWEVCNKVGGIHTVVSTKARTLTQRLGDRYIALGPWLLSNQQQERAFEPESGFESFAESCRALGVPIQVGRWRIPGRPRTILVEFSKLFEQRATILTGLWDQYKVDSLTGGWDYLEPVLFGHAAGLVIERWWQEYL